MSYISHKPSRSISSTMRLNAVKLSYGGMGCTCSRLRFIGFELMQFLEHTHHVDSEVKVLTISRFVKKPGNLTLGS
jgi:hypothetical protein